MYDLIRKAVFDDEAAIQISKMDKDVTSVVDAISELSLDEAMKLGMQFKRFPLGCDLTEVVAGTCASDLEIMDLLGIHPSKQKDAASLTLIKAVVKMRSTKELQEIEAIERACDVGYLMHTMAMRTVRPGLSERYVGGIVDGTANSLASKVSFATIFSQHGEIMHGNPSTALLEDGRLVLCDAGCELDDYCSDHTRTYPVNGKFTQRQLDIYNIVVECHD